MATKKKITSEDVKVEEKVQEITPQKVKIYANFELMFCGKRYQKGDCIEAFDGDAKRLVEKGYASKKK